MSDFELIIAGLWKMAWIWIPLTLILIGAGIYEWKKGIRL